MNATSDGWAERKEEEEEEEDAEGISMPRERKEIPTELSRKMTGKSSNLDLCCRLWETMATLHRVEALMISCIVSKSSFSELAQSQLIFMRHKGRSHN